MDILDEERLFTAMDYRDTLELDLYTQPLSLNFYESELQATMNELPSIDITTQIMSTSTSNVEIHGEPTKNKTPTGFLDLPRELRQCILDYSYESKEVEFSEWYEAYMYVDWANVLREVHHVVAEDVEYIEKRWNKKVVVKGWKSSPNNDVAREIGGESSDTRRERLRRSLCPNTGRANIDDVCYMVCSIT